LDVHSIYILYITCKFFMTIKCHIGWHVSLTREIWMGKKNACLNNLPLFILTFFLLKCSIIILLWLISSQKNNVSNQKSLNKSNNFQRDWWIIFCYIIFILHLKFYTNISPITSLLEYIFHFSYFMMGIILVQIIYSSHNF
jgi:hypothetical protein